MNADRKFYEASPNIRIGRTSRNTWSVFASVYTPKFRRWDKTGLITEEAVKHAVGDALEWCREVAA